MKHLIITFGLVFVVVAAPVEDDIQAKILKFENDSDGKGNYRFSFETSNGITREEVGTVMNEGLQNQYIFVEGTVSYIDADGNKQEFRYFADQNGYEVLPPAQQVGVQAAAVDPNVLATLLG